jgi:hypothetical protein
VPAPAGTGVHRAGWKSPLEGWVFGIRVRAGTGEAQRADILHTQRPPVRALRGSGVPRSPRSTTKPGSTTETRKSTIWSSPGRAEVALGCTTARSVENFNYLNGQWCYGPAMLTWPLRPLDRVWRVTVGKDTAMLRRGAARRRCAGGRTADPHHGGRDQ